MKVTIPVDVCIKRFYHTYVTVEADASDDSIRRIVMEDVIENQDNVLIEDEDIDIEEQDFVFIDIDHEI